MDHYSILNLIVLTLELVILAGQLRLSYKIHKQSAKKEHAIFVPKATNILHLPEVAHHYNFKYNLTEPLQFAVRGDNPVMVTTTTVIADGITRYQSQYPSNTMFIDYEGFDVMDVSLELRDSDLAKPKIKIEIILTLEVLSEKYQEKIEMEFQKKEDDWWDTIRMNIL